MANKYHFNQKTGRIGQCRATKKGCPLGEDTPHFNSKDEAQRYVEKDSSKGKYSFSTITKSGVKDLETLRNLPKIPGGQYEYDDPDTTRKYIAQHAPEFTVKESEMRVGYINESLLEKDGNYYLTRAYAGWHDYEMSNVIMVEKQTKAQLKTRVLEHGERINDPEMVKTMDELYELNKEYSNVSYRDSNYKEVLKKGGFTVRKINFNDPEEKIKSGKYTIYVQNKSYTHEREDGSKIIVEPIRPLADRSLTDEPNEISVDIEFTENGELENARRMDEGVVVFDSRLNRGFVLKYKSGSEESDSSEFVVDDDGIRKIEENEAFWSYSSSQEVYKIEGDGQTVSEYYKQI